MTRAAQLEKLRQVRVRKADQANMALAGAQRSRAHWEAEHRKWSRAFEQIRAIGGSVIDEVMEEAAEIGEPYLVYQKVQTALRRQRQAEIHALHRRNHAATQLGDAREAVVTRTHDFNQAEGRKEAATNIAQTAAKAEAVLVEAMEEEQTLDDFAAIKHIEAQQ